MGFISWVRNLFRKPEPDVKSLDDMAGDVISDLNDHQSIVEMNEPGWSDGLIKDIESKQVLSPSDMWGPNNIPVNEDNAEWFNNHVGNQATANLADAFQKASQHYEITGEKPVYADPVTLNLISAPYSPVYTASLSASPGSWKEIMDAKQFENMLKNSLGEPSYVPGSGPAIMSPNEFEILISAAKQGFLSHQTIPEKMGIDLGAEVERMRKEEEEDLIEEMRRWEEQGIIIPSPDWGPFMYADSAKKARTLFENDPDIYFKMARMVDLKARALQIEARALQIEEEALLDKVLEEELDEMTEEEREANFEWIDE